MAYLQQTIKFHTPVCFERMVFSRCSQAFVGTASYSDADYLPPKDTSVNPARLLFSLKWTEYLITLIYRMLLNKAACYLAVTGTLINIIIRIFSPPTSLRVYCCFLLALRQQNKSLKWRAEIPIERYDRFIGGIYGVLLMPSNPQRLYTNPHSYTSNKEWSVKLSSERKSFYFYSAWYLQPSVLQTNVAGVGDCIHCYYRHKWARLISELAGRWTDRRS